MKDVFSKERNIQGSSFIKGHVETLLCCDLVASNVIFLCQKTAPKSSVHQAKLCNFLNVLSLQPSYPWCISGGDLANRASPVAMAGLFSSDYFCSHFDGLYQIKASTTFELVQSNCKCGFSWLLYLHGKSLCHHKLLECFLCIHAFVLL